MGGYIAHLYAALCRCASASCFAYAILLASAPATLAQSATTTLPQSKGSRQKFTPEQLLAQADSPAQPAQSLPAAQAPPVDSEVVTTQPVEGETEVTPSESDISLRDLEPFGKWRFRLGGSITGTFTDNVFIQHDNKESDFIFTIAPGISVGRGDFFDKLVLRRETFRIPERFENADLVEDESRAFFYVSYVPSYTAFVDHTNENTFDQDVIAEVKYLFTKLELGAYVRYQTFNVPDIDVGDRVKQKILSSTAYVDYQVTEKTALSSTVYTQYREPERFIESFEIWDENWVDYNYSTKTRIGVGFTLGTAIPADGPTQYYGRLLSRASWKPTGKLSFAAKAGLELRSVDGFGERLYFVYGLESRYNVTDRTQILLSVYQKNQSSANEQAINYITRGVEAEISQQILDRFTVEVAGGYQNIEYTNFSQQAFARSDNYFYVRPSLNTTITRWLNADLEVQYRSNDSTSTNRSFDEFSTAVRLNFVF
jgi:hypothetical protein